MRSGYQIPIDQAKTTQAWQLPVTQHMGGDNGSPEQPGNTN